MTMTLRNHQSSGFTLLELLIAMVIFSIMSLMAYGGLHSVLNSNASTQAYEKDLKGLQRSMMFIEKDLRQLTARPRHSGYNETQGAIVSEDLDIGALLEFTRSGNPNPANKLRSSLQRVRYVLEQEELQRWSWSLVDHLDAEPVIMPLVTSIETVSLRFMNAKKEWLESWASEDKSELPKAIEINITHKRWGKIRRLISIY